MSQEERDVPNSVRRRERVAGILLVAAAAAGLPWLVHGWFHFANDSATYIGCARSLLAGEGYSYLGEPFRIRPPGFSALLTPVLATFGTNFAALNAFVSLWGLAVLGLLYFLNVRRLGVPVACALCVTVWLNPPFRRFCNQVLSDVPGAAAMLACLLFERDAAGSRSLRKQLLLGLLLGLAAYLRTILVLLIPAVVLGRVLRWGSEEDREPAASFVRTRLAPVVVVPVLVLLPWTVRNALVVSEEPVDQHAAYSYSVVTLRADPRDPSSPLLTFEDHARRVAARSVTLLATVGSGLRDLRPGPGTLMLGGLTLACGAAVALRGRAPPELFLFACVAVMLPFPAEANRLSLPLYLLGLSAVAAVATSLAARVLGARAGPAVVSAVLLAAAALRFEPQRNWAKIEQQHLIRVERCAEIRAMVDPEVRLGMPVGLAYGVHLDRPVYSLQFALRARMHREALDEAVAALKLDAVVLFDDNPLHASMLAHLRRQHGPARRLGSTCVVDVLRPAR